MSFSEIELYLYIAFMGNLKLKGKDLRKIKYKSSRAQSLAIDIASKHWKHWTKQEKLEKLQDVLLHPENYLNHEYLGLLAEEFAPVVKMPEGTSYKLNDKSKTYRVYGRKFIDSMAIQQMDMVMKLPVVEQGALMPDAHVGYGLPIGSAIATANEVIPYGVGLDIGCRMSLSIYDVPSNFIQRNRYQAIQALKSETHFGIGTMKSHSADHEVLDSEVFNELSLLKQLRGKAHKQLGSSGSGNHFVEIGEVVLESDNRFGFEAGKYVGVMAHSGSRGLGATIANYYHQVAMDTCWLPKQVQHLAWLDLNSEAGLEYWMAMNLAGEYAKACHDVIHHRLAKALGLKRGLKIENHHNFAWKEKQADGRELIVHRKGSTPAKDDELGLIPANMKDPGFIVSGLGDHAALNSASHGAGRKMSRTKARNSISGSDVKKELKHSGVTLIGGGVDEAPMAYKNLEDVMASQQQLVKREGKFIPKIVRMDKN